MTYAQLKTDLLSKAGTKLVSERPLSVGIIRIANSTAEQTFSANLDKYELQIMHDNNAIKSLRKYIVYVDEPGTGSENAYLESSPTPLDNVRKLISDEAASKPGVLGYEIINLNEEQKWGIVNVFRLNGQNKVTETKFFIYIDNGSFAFNQFAV